LENTQCGVLLEIGVREDSGIVRDIYRKSFFRAHFLDGCHLDAMLSCTYPLPLAV